MASSLKPLCCAFRVLCDEQQGGMFVLFYSRENWFSWIWSTKSRSATFKTLSVSVCVFADMCVHSGVLRSTVWSLVLLRWCRVSGPAPLGRGHPPAGTHRSGCWTPLISLHCWLLHTPPPLRIKGIQTPSVLRDTSQATSLPTTLSAAPPYWFPPRSDFPRPVSCSSSFLTNYAVKLMAPSPKLQPLWNTFHDPP